jgi:hypothetical protein
MYAFLQTLFEDRAALPVPPLLASGLPEAVAVRVNFGGASGPLQQCLPLPEARWNLLFWLVPMVPSVSWFPCVLAGCVSRKGPWGQRLLSSLLLCFRGGDG